MKAMKKEAPKAKSKSKPKKLDPEAEERRLLKSRKSCAYHRTKAEQMNAGKPEMEAIIAARQAASQQHQCSKACAFWSLPPSSPSLSHALSLSLHDFVSDRGGRTRITKAYKDQL